jgi:DNA-binding transcriptional regulator YhcF (GntR family)
MRPSALSSMRGSALAIQVIASAGIVRCVIGPIASAYSAVPMPTLPPSRNPVSKTIASTPVRTTRIECPRPAIPTVLRGLAAPRLLRLLRLLGAWRSDSGIAYRELASALRGLVIGGSLPPHTRLPSERALAQALGVSRNTATAALGILREEGYLDARPGIGSWIVHRPITQERPDEPFPTRPETIDLTHANLPAAPVLGELSLAAARAMRRELGGNGYEPFGLRATRFSWRPRRIPPPSTRCAPTAASRSASLSGPTAGHGSAVRDAARRQDSAGIPRPRLPEPHRCRDLG